MGEVVVYTVECELDGGTAEERGMLGFGEGMMSTGIGMFVSMLYLNRGTYIAR